MQVGLGLYQRCKIGIAKWVPGCVHRGRRFLPRRCDLYPRYTARARLQRENSRKRNFNDFQTRSMGEEPKMKGAGGKGTERRERERGVAALVTFVTITSHGGGGNIGHRIDTDGLTHRCNLFARSDKRDPQQSIPSVPHTLLLCPPPPCVCLSPKYPIISPILTHDNSNPLHSVSTLQ